jgi:hypothetical protein
MSSIGSAPEAQAWIAVDCEICGAPAFERCRPILNPQGCAHCKRINQRTLEGKSFCGGGARERAELGIQI